MERAGKSGPVLISVLDFVRGWFLLCAASANFRPRLPTVLQGLGTRFLVYCMYRSNELMSPIGWWREAVMQTDNALTTDNGGNNANGGNNIATEVLELRESSGDEGG